MTEETEIKEQPLLKILVGALHHGQLRRLPLLQQISPCYFLTLVQDGESRLKKSICSLILEYSHIQ